MNSASPGDAEAATAAPRAPEANPNTDDEDAMHQESSTDGELDSSSEEEGNRWTESVSKAQRRRNRQASIVPTATLQAAHGSKATSEFQLRQVSRKPMPRPAPLPINDFKLVLRPQDGLNLSKVLPSTLSLALLHATNTSWRQANLRLQVDVKQNTATVSTPSADVAKLLLKTKQIVLNNAHHAVVLYGLAPDDAVKGVIRGVPVEFTEDQIIQNIDQEGFELYSSRRIGKESTTVILTFAGPKVPHYVRLYGAEHRCTLYKKTVPVCSRCHEIGHRNTTCPQPAVSVCHLCGTRDPAHNHECRAKCDLCSGPHLTASRGCPKRYITPYILRQRELRRQRQRETGRLSRRDGTPQGGHFHSTNPDVREQSGDRHRDRSATRARRGPNPSSDSRPRAQSKSRRQHSQSRPAGGSTTKKVSWTDKTPPIALDNEGEFPPLGHAQGISCHECNHLRALLAQQAQHITAQADQLAKQTELINSLHTRIEAMERTQAQEPQDKRKKAKRDNPIQQATPDADASSGSHDQPTPTHSTRLTHPSKDDPLTSLQNTVLRMAEQMQAFQRQAELMQTFQQAICTLQQSIQDNQVNSAPRLDALESNVSQILLSLRSSKRATPYTKQSTDDKA